MSSSESDQMAFVLAFQNTVIHIIQSPSIPGVHSRHNYKGTPFSPLSNDVKWILATFYNLTFLPHHHFSGSNDFSPQPPSASIKKSTSVLSAQQPFFLPFFP